MYERWEEIMLKFVNCVKKNNPSQADKLILRLSELFRSLGQLDQEQFIEIWNEVRNKKIPKTNYLIGQEYINISSELMNFINEYMCDDKEDEED